MGFAVIHMEKYKVNDVRGIQSHNNRERKSKSNQDIDYEKSSENYHLLKCDNYTNKIVDTIYEYATESNTIRKDAVVLCSFIITSDNATMTKMSPEVERDFFEKSVEFISERYGKENVVSATVHKDERTPHMHITVVPIKEKRLCAKKLFDKKELSSLQTDFAEKIGSQFEMQRGKEGSDQKHLSEIRFKISREKEQLELIKGDLEKNREVIKQQVDDLNKNHLINLKQKKDIQAQKIELDELTIKAESKMNDFNAITKAFNERSEIIKNQYEKANVVLAKQADEIKNRTERIAALKETEKAQQETFDFNSKRITEQTEKIRKNKEIISKQVEGFNKTNEIFTKNKEVIKNQSLKIENQAIEIKKGEHAIESMRAIEKSVRDDLERTVSDFNNQDKQVLNRAVAFIKTLPNQFQEGWSRFNVERKRTPSAWAKKLANEKKNGLER